MKFEKVGALGGKQEAIMGNRLRKIYSFSVENQLKFG